MKALIFQSPFSMKLEDVPIPDVKSSTVLVKVKYASICATDLRIYKGERNVEHGRIIGHEFVGEVVKVGNDVKDIEVGSDVVIYPVVACGECYFCKRGYENLCVDRRTIGLQLDGGFAEYAAIPWRPYGNIIEAPSNISYEEASLLEPLACCTNAMDVCKVGDGSRILVVGAGPMGLMNMVMARGYNASELIVSEMLDERLDYVKMLGADVIIDPKTSDLVKVVKEATEGIGVDAAIVTVGMPSLIEDVLKCVRKGGIVNIFAGCPPESLLKIDPNFIHYNMLNLTSSQNATAKQFLKTVKMLDSGKVDVKPLITHRTTLDRALEAFESRMDRKGLKYVIRIQ